MNERVADHVAAFNEAVRSSDWQTFAARFASGARMEFLGVPVGPFEGRDAIVAAYQDNPPTDTMTALSVESIDGTDSVRFEWDEGGTGTMRLSWDDAGQVTALQVHFD